MEDQHRLVEKVDLSLDNRQIFLFFVASAVLISMVFALGVVVGKRMVISGAEQRAPTDPLALLDQIGTNEPGDDDQLTCHSALTGDNTENKASKSSAKSPAPEKAEPVALAAAPPLPVPKKEQAKPAAKKEPAPKAPDREPVLASKPAGKKATKGEQKRNEADSYTLQLSSFQDRDEAERFMQKLKDAGLSPHIIAARIPDRGVWYRVRIGSYHSWDEALAAKTKFETTQKVIAYVAKR